VLEQAHLAYQVGIVSKTARRLGSEAAQLAAMLRSFARLSGVLKNLGAGEGVSRA